MTRFEFEDDEVYLMVQAMFQFRNSDRGKTYDQDALKKIEDTLRNRARRANMHFFTYTGEIPNTGPIKCSQCGEIGEKAGIYGRCATLKPFLVSMTAVEVLERWVKVMAEDADDAISKVRNSEIWEMEMESGNFESYSMDQGEDWEAEEFREGTVLNCADYTRFSFEEE